MGTMRRRPGGWFQAGTATVTGDVTVGPESSVWFGAAIRGDVAPVTIGARTNIQDNAVVHCDLGVPNDLGEDVTIGHAAVVHGRRVGRGSLIGMNATLLGRSEIGEEAIVAAGAVVPPGMVVPDRAVVAGVPAKVVREVNKKDLEYLRRLPPQYAATAAKYADESPPATIRIGHGHDVHRVQPGGRLVLGGQVVADDRSFVAHSDGDVVAHAVVDAVLGALRRGDIGRHFDNTDPRWRDADSRLFLEHAAKLAADAGLAVSNLDVTILAESPKLAPHVDAMAAWLASILGGSANVKAGTNERLDAVGRGEAISATAVLILASA